MLTGENGILKRAAEAKEETGTAQIDEQVKLAINATLINGVGKVGYDDLRDELDNQLGEGQYTITPQSNTATSWTVTVNGKYYKISSTGRLTNVLASENGTEPYLPSSEFKQVTGTNLSTGLVIADSVGNEYVWIEVPKTLYDNASYNTKTEEADKKPNRSKDYDKIEYCLQKYTSTYRNGTSHKDEYDSKVVTEATGLSSSEYIALKQKMLKSVYENGGFWIGRYEAGIGKNRTMEDVETPIATDLKPTSKVDQYPLTWVTCSQAQTLASRLSGSGYTSSLMFGVQWDLVLKYLETKAVEKGIDQAAIQDDLNSNSASWGNYFDSTFTLNRGKYAIDVWDEENGPEIGYDTPFEWKNYNEDESIYNSVVSSEKKQVDNDNFGGIIITTGASDDTSKQNIYDLAGNVDEWTLEYTSDTSLPCILRGGYCGDYGSVYPACDRNICNATGSNSVFRFPSFTLLRRRPVF